MLGRCPNASFRSTAKEFSMPAIAPDLQTLFRQIRLAVFDFDGVFTDNGVYVTDEGREMVLCSRGDGMGIGLIQQLGLEPMILSKEPVPICLHRAKKLKMPCIHGCDDKAAAMHALCQKHGVSLEQVMFMGNDVNDIPVLQIVGLPIVVADAHEDVLPLGRYVTRLPGGRGAVREVCDLILRTWNEAGIRIDRP